MVTAQTQYRLVQAQTYFREHLAVGDYYAEGQESPGQWLGEGARRLGLNGRVQEAAFLRLCENRHPDTGRTLTARLNTVRQESGGTVANRRIFYDFTFSPPKSVSIQALIGGDDRIREAHHRALRVALTAFERFAQVRMRQAGADRSRSTGNLVMALFTHETSRSLDPHLHTHVIAFNATWDPAESRWKALQNHGLLQARKFAENAYYHELARDLRRLGYRCRDRARGDFEIDGIPEALCTRFSKRHREIDQALERLLADRPDLAGANPMALREYLATANRARKQREIGRTALQRHWEGQLSTGERDALRTLARTSPEPSKSVSLPEAVQWAEDHLFDRASVVPEHRIWQEALGRARGGDFGLAELTDFTGHRGYLRGPTGTVTREDVLRRELAILRIAHEGAHACHPLVPNPGASDARLDPDQKRSLEALVQSTHRVTVFRGGAGTGKSFVLRELTARLQEAGRVPVVLAPQRQQVVEMEQAGFPAPTTVAQFLTRRECPEGAVLIVDEAGQIGGRQMLDLLEMAVRHRARVVLSGDTRQHGPVEASDALRAIEQQAGIQPIELRRIRRQDPALGRNRREKRAIAEYRRAVAAAAAGDLEKSFACLERLGAIVACLEGTQAERLADEYLRLTREGASTVVVSQTWSEVHRLNARIRDGLRAHGLLGSDEVRVQALEKCDLTQAQKQDPRAYPPEAVLVFNRRFRKVEAGVTGRLAGFLADHVLVETAGRLVPVAHRFLDRVTVCQPRDIPVARGDRLLIKANRRLASGARVTNGERVTVAKVSPEGRIQLTDGRELGPEFREFLPGYAVTSYGSQGKTVDYVLISDSGSRAATNAQQWYVSISRGRKGLKIYTADPQALRERIRASGERPLATELVRPGPWFPRWSAVRQGLRRFGERVLRRLALIHFARPQPSTPPVHHERNRKLGV